MSKSLEVVKSALHYKALDCEIQCALDSKYTGKLPSEHTHYTPSNYSRLFRAYSAACLILNADPNTELIDSPADIPEEASWLGRELIKLLNQSVEKNPSAQYRFRSKISARHSVCPDTEKYFMESTGHADGEVPELPNKQTIYTNDFDEPILFTQGFKRVQSSISFADVSVDEIDFPAGTIFRVRKRPVIKTATVKSGLEVASLRDISSLQPLRLSVFAIPHNERLEATTDKPLPNQLEQDHRTLLNSMPAISTLDFYLRCELERTSDAVIDNEAKKLVSQP